MTTTSTPSAVWIRGVACFFLLSGCKGCEGTDTLPQLLDEVDATPTGVWVAEGLGVSPTSVNLYAINSLGASVAAGDLSVTSEGSVSSSATPDALGWATVEVSATVPGFYAVDATVSGASGTGGAWVVEGAPGELDAPGIVLPGTATLLAAAGNGVAAAVGGDVWWADPNGAAPFRVLSLAEPVTQLLGVEIDNDGVTDLLAASGSEVVLLRGRDSGGLGWAGGWTTADGRTVTGLTASDANGDSLLDLTLALDDADGTWLGQLTGDGAWGFTLEDALHLDYDVYGLSAEDLDGNGVGEVTVLSEDGFLRRYTHIDGSWASTLSGTQYDLGIGEGSRMLPSADVTGDGVADLVAYGPALDGVGWHGWVVTAGAASPTQYGILSNETTDWAGLVLADLSGDGTSDYVLTTPGRLSRGIWDDATVNFLASSFVDAPTGPALAVLDIDTDGVPDVVSGDDTLRVYYGEQTADDTATPDVDESQPWGIRATSVSNFGTHLALEPVIGDRTGDGIADLVALVSPTGTGVSLQGFLGSARTETTSETLYSGGTVSLSTTGTAVGLAVCGTTAWALYEEADDTGALLTWLVRANLGTGMGPTLSGSRISVNGIAIACGDFPSGPVAVADASGEVSYVDDTGSVLSGENIGPTSAIAAADAEGDGVDEVVGCAEAGCFVGSADLDGDGYGDLVVQDSTGVTVTTLAGSWTLDTGGAARLSDADGDGLVDLVLGDNGAAAVVRMLPGGPTPALASWEWRPVLDPVLFGDLDGDGLPDAFFFGEDRDTTDDDTAWVGVTLYAHAE